MSTEAPSAHAHADEENVAVYVRRAIGAVREGNALRRDMAQTSRKSRALAQTTHSSWALQGFQLRQLRFACAYTALPIHHDLPDHPSASHVCEYAPHSPLVPPLTCSYSWQISSTTPLSSATVSIRERRAGRRSMLRLTIRQVCTSRQSLSARLRSASASTLE